jgi:hypothetical protein
VRPQRHIGPEQNKPSSAIDAGDAQPRLRDQSAAAHNRCCEHKTQGSGFTGGHSRHDPALCTLPVPIKRGNVSQSKASEKVLLLLSLIKMTYKRAKPITTFAISAEMFDHSSAREC